MPRKLSDEGLGEAISPLIDVVMNAFAAMFIILVIYISVFQDVPTPQALKFLKVDPPPAVRGQNYAFTLPVAGGVGDRRFKLNGDLSLLNLQFDTNTGTIFGVANTTLTNSAESRITFPIKVECEFEVEDPQYRAARGATFVMLSRALPYPETKFTIVRQAEELSGGRVGREYESVLGALGGVEPYQWKLIFGKLPQGLNLDTNQGRIYGTPMESGSFVFNVTAQHSPGEFSFEGVSHTWAGGVSKGQYKLVIRDSLKHSLHLPVAQRGEGYFATVTSNGRLPEEQIIWTARVPGLTFSQTNWNIVGIPLEAGAFGVSYRVVSGTNDLGGEDLNLVILESRPAAEIGAAVFNLWVGKPVEYVIPYRGLREPVVVTNVMPLPPNLWIEGNMIKGIPLEPGLASLSLQITDALGMIANGNLTLRIGPAPETLQITSASDVHLGVGQDVVWQPSFQGGEGATRVSLVGEMIPGLQFTNNELKGIPLESGVWTNMVRADDLVLKTSATKVITFHVNDLQSSVQLIPPPLPIRTNSVTPKTEPGPIMSAPAGVRNTEQVFDDKETLLSYQKEQAEKGNAESQYAVGIRYLTGNGLEKNEQLAIEWLQRASSGGNLKARAKLRDLRSPKRTLFGNEGIQRDSK
jgi:hypothetical protein